MASETLYQTVLVLHIMGLITAAGVTVTSYFAFKEFWKLYDTSNPQGLSAFKAMSKLQMVGMFGLILLVLSGVGMLAIVDWEYGSQLWFKVKLILVALIFVNSFTQGRIQTLKLRALIHGQKPVDNNEVELLKRNLAIFQLSQIAIIALIIICSVYKFT